MVVNGESLHFDEPVSVSDLLLHLGWHTEARVAIERNGEIVPRSEWAQTICTASDTLEVVRFVGGG